MYDYLIVGTGLFGAAFSHFATKKNKRCLLIDKRNHIGGNLYTKKIEGIDVHCYGAHIFRTSDEYIWDFIRSFGSFNSFINSPIANYKGELYNLPFNMNTFYQMWGVKTPEEALKKINEQRAEVTGKPSNLEEKAIYLVGRDIYEKLIKGYTEKQWGRSCRDLPESILNRLPVRYTYDNNYFNAKYQGVPDDGYTKLIENMMIGSDVILNKDFLASKTKLLKMAKKTIFTGTIDSFFDYLYGPLEYRSLRFEHQILNERNHQGVAVMNFTDNATPYTRIIEHKHFVFGNQEKSVITREYPADWTTDVEPYYPINNLKNQQIYNKYKTLSLGDKNVIFGGRLGEYRYYDMQDTIKSVFKLALEESLL